MARSHHCLRLFALSVILANVACLTTKTLAEAQPQTASARDFLHDYWNHPSDADAKYRGKRVEVAGLVDQLHVGQPEGAALDLQTDERTYVVRCWLAAGATSAASGLGHGQLVAVRGIGIGDRKGGPELNDCAVAWQGDRPGERPEDSARQALVAALTVNVCSARSIRRTLANMHADPDLPSVRKAHDASVQLEERSLASLAAARATPLPCDHPLVPIVSRCRLDEVFGFLGANHIVEGNRIFQGSVPTLEERAAGSECATMQLKEALEQLQTSALP